MPYKDPEKMAAYMRDYRSRKRVKTDAAFEELEQSLALAEKYLCEQYKYWTGDRSDLHVKPRVEIREIVTRKALGEGPVETQQQIRKVKLVDKKAKKAGEATIKEAVPDYMKPTVKRVLAYAHREGISELTDIKVKRDIEEFLDLSPLDRVATYKLQRRSWTAPKEIQEKLDKGASFKSLDMSLLTREYERLLAEEKDANWYFEMLVSTLVQEYTDEEILEEIQHNNKASAIFTHWPSKYVKLKIREIRDMMYPAKDKKRPSKDLAKTIDLFHADAAVQDAIMKGELLPLRKKSKSLGLPIEKQKKKTRYSVEVEGGES